MASMLKEIARRSPELIVKCEAPEAWAATARLRSQFVMTTMDAMPARVAAASAEYNTLKAKVIDRSATVNDIAVGTARCFELYCFYLTGRFLGSGSLNP